MTIWTVTKTPCYPKAFKVHQEGFWGDNYGPFFAEESEAWNEANRRNKRENPQSSFKIDIMGYKVEICIGEVWFVYKFDYNPYDGTWSIHKITSETWMDAQNEFDLD